MKKIIIKDLADLKVFARALSAELTPGAVVALVGDLGAGKTALTQLVAKNLGVPNNVNSPTFSILKIYPVAGRAFTKFCHLDLYRLADAKNHLGWEEYLGDKDTVCFVEWAEKIKDQLPPQTIWLRFAVLANNRRRLIRT